MQHLISSYRGEDVEDEVSSEDILQRGAEGDDVGSVAAGQNRPLSVIASMPLATSWSMAGLHLVILRKADGPPAIHLDAKTHVTLSDGPIGGDAAHH